MKTWAEIRKDGLWQSIIGGTIAGVAACALIAVFTPLGPWGLRQIAPICSILSAGVAAIASWFATTIPVSRGQCVVWLIAGFALCTTIVATRAARKLAAARAPENLGPEEALLLRYFAQQSGRIFNTEDPARDLRISDVRVQHLLSGLKALKLVKENQFCWFLSERGRHFVIERRWA